MCSYSEHAAGIEHELVILVNGSRTGGGGGVPDAAIPDTVAPLSRAQIAGELRGVPHRLIELERPVLDLAAYGAAARELEHERVCFVNSYSVVLVDGWLRYLARAHERPGVGLVGATGSWESRSELVPGGLEHWAYQLAKLPSNRRFFPRFPNPHIRSTAFLIERRTVLALGLERARKKNDAYRLESGKRSMTRQLQARNLQSLVVGRDGRGYTPEEWPHSATFRAGGQANLLVADNRTSQWRDADRERQRELSWQAWRGADAATVARDVGHEPAV